MSTLPNPTVEQAKAAALEARTWCDLHGTVMLRTPAGLYYVLLWNAEGEAPMTQFIGRSIIEARARLVNRSSPTYGAEGGLDPEGFEP